MATRGRKQSVSAQDILLTMVNDAIDDVSDGNYLGRVASERGETAPAQVPSTYGYLQAARAAAPVEPNAPLRFLPNPLNTAVRPDAVQAQERYGAAMGLPDYPVQQSAPVQSFSPLSTEVRPDVAQAQERYNAAMGIYDYPVQEEAGFRFTAPIPIPYPATIGPVANSNALLNTHAPATNGGTLADSILRNGYDYIQSADNRSPVQITTR